MRIVKAQFVKGLVGDDELLHDGLPQVAFVGRSNVGKSSLINTLTGTSISRTSGYAGSTQEINAYLVNDDMYFMDLPGYGFARTSGRGKEKIGDLIEFYLFKSAVEQAKVVIVVDAGVGVTDKDASMFNELLEHNKSIIIAASKIDKLNQSEFHKSITKLRTIAHGFPVVPFSSKSKKGIPELLAEIAR